ncbi:hypothetical protein TGPRC2_209270 [Toxoplasma gondii TgCatPRC2]|uniref:Uncharacterized protein n=1 Tax=Toxoplasma gondii TgCatPRC2 TaxID=1130821 RepID=A0A151HGS6_TOXGO|nr:hypothetical protein TGPRC2_209270 [Toxoplasma gondii TgCatPRC2]
MAPCSCAVSAEYAELHPPDLLEDESLLARIECLETPQKEGLFSRKFDPRKSRAKALSDIRGGNGGTTLHLPFSGFSHQAVPGKQKQIKQRISSEEKAGTPPSSESHSSSSPLSCSVSPSFRDAVALLQRLVPPPVSCSSLPLLASPDSSPRFFPPECPSVSSLSSLASALGSKHLQPSSCASSLSAPSELPSVSLADSPAPVSLSSCDASPCCSNSSSSSVSPSSSHIPHILASLTATHADAHTQLHRNTREAVEACSSLSGEETGKPCLPQVASPSAELPRPASKHREKPLSRLCLTTVQATCGETEEKGVLLEASGELKRLRSRGEFGSRDQSVELRSIGLFLLSLLPDSDFRFGGVPESGDTQFPFGNRSESSDFFSCLGVAEEERDVRVSPRDANEKRRGEKRCEWSPVSKIRNPQTDKTDEIALSGALPDLNKRAVQSILDAVAVYVQSRELASRDASGSPSLPSVELGNSATREAPFLRVEVCSDGEKDLESLQVSTRSPLPAPLSSELFFLSVLHRVNGATTPSVSRSSSASLRVEFPQRQLHLCTLKALRALQGVPGWTSTAASLLALWLTDFRYQFSGSLETPRDALLDEERLGLAWQLVCGEAGGLGLLLEALRRPAASKSLSRRILAEDARVCAQDRKRHEEKEQGVAKAGEAGRGRGDMSEKDKVCVCAPRASSTFSVEKARFFASLLGLLFAPLTTLTCRSRTAALVAWMLCEESRNGEECSNPNTDKREKRANEEENETSLLCLLLNRLCDSLPTLSPLFQRREGETWRRQERKEEERTTNTVCTSEDREGCALLALLELLDALVELLACSFFYKSVGARCTYSSREQRRARDGQVENGEEGESGSDVVARKADGSTSPVKKSTVPAAADVCRVLLVLRTAEVLTACATGDSSLFCSLSSFSVLFEKVPSPIAPNYMALCSLTKLVPLLTQCDSSSSSFSVSSSFLSSYSPFSSSVSSSAEAFQSGEEEERASHSSFKTVSALCVSVLQCVARALSRSACVLRSDLQAEVRDRRHRREEETQRGDKETVGRKAGFMASRSREDVRGGEEDVQAERGESKEAREGDEQKGAARRLFAEAAQAESAGVTGGSFAEAAGKETSARRQGDACGEKDTETDTDDRLRAKARLGRGAREEGSPADRRQCLCGSVFVALHSLLLRSSCALLSDVPAAFGFSFSPQQRVRQNACLSSSENSFPSPNTVNTGAGGPAFVACKNVDARTALRVRLGASVESERPSISFLAPPLRVENEVSRQRDALGRLHPVCSSSSLETVEPESKRTFVLEERTVGLSTSERPAVGGPGRRSAFRERRLSSLPPVAEWLQRHSREDTLSSAYEILHATLRTLSEMIPSSETKQRDTLLCPYPVSPSSPPLSFSSSSSSLPSSSSPLSFSSRSSSVPDTQCCRSPLSAWGSAEFGEEATESRSVCTAGHEFSKDLVRSSWQRLFDTATLYSDLRVPILLLAERLFHASPEETATPKAQAESLHTAVPLGSEERKRRLQFDGDSQEIRRKWQEADEQAHQERVVLSFYRQTVRAVLLQFFHVSVSEETRMKENSNHRDRESCLEEEQRREVCRLLRLRSVASMHALVVPKEDGLLKSRTERRGESEDGARPLSATQSSKETEKEDTERGETAGKDTERNEETKGQEKEESERNAKGAVPGEIEEMKTTTTDVEVEEEGETRKSERGRTRRYGTLLAWLQQEGEEEELLLLSLARLAALLGPLEEEEGDRREEERRPRSVSLKEMHHLLLAAYEQECEDRKEPERLPEKTFFDWPVDCHCRPCLEANHDDCVDE